MGVQRIAHAEGGVHVLGGRDRQDVAETDRGERGDRPVKADNISCVEIAQAHLSIWSKRVDAIAVTHGKTKSVHAVVSSNLT